MPIDPYREREQQKYDNPIPSREFILALLKDTQIPVSRDELVARLELADEEQQEALRRRLRAMERDGQLVFTRNKKYALPEKLEMVRGMVLGHREGYGFLRPDAGGDDLFLPVHQMASLFHGDHILAQPMGTDSRGRREARLVRVLDKAPRQLVGRYYVDAGIGCVVPDDTRINQEILIPEDARQGVRHGQVVVVEVSTRPSRRGNAKGRVLEVLGEDMAPGMEVEIALRNHDIPHTWPEPLLEEIKGFTEEVPEPAKQGRLDLRGLPLVTIDGEDARDFDDAVYCERREGGGWTLWVAIADVSYYVRPDTALDNEAFERGNSVYFPNQVVPMLPEVLSNGLCSLNPHVDRLCLACEMTVSSKGQLEGYRFVDAVMNSHARLTYTKVAAILDGDPQLSEQYAELLPHLFELQLLFHSLKKARRKRGAIEFETEETRFIFNAQRKIEQIVPLVRNEAHMIIEECMILANVAAARFIEKHKGHALFRVHDSPTEEKLTNFRQFLGELGLNLKGGDNPHPCDYADLLDKLGERPDRELIQTMLLRSMQQAMYEADNSGHFGLSLISYAHFTSPIRRYPDLIVHRTIKYLLAKQHGNPPQRWTPTGGYHYLREEMDHLGEHCSMTERVADDATRDVADWLKCEFMQDRLGEEFAGVIAAVTQFGFFVRLADLHIDGLVHVSTLSNDYYHFDPVRAGLYGEHFGRSFRLGDEVRVKLTAVNLDERKIDFELLEGGHSRGGRSKEPRKRAASATEPGSKSKKDKPSRKRKKRSGKQERARHQKA